MNSNGGDGMSTTSWAGASICPSCKRVVKHKPQGGPHRWHGCRIRWIKRRVAWGYFEGWVDGYEFANGEAVEMDENECIDDTDLCEHGLRFGCEDC